MTTSAWTAAHSRYLGAEIVAGVVVTIVLSSLFAVAVFGRSLPVDVATIPFQLDTATQGLIVGFMSAIVPTILGRKRKKAGSVSAITGEVRLPRHAILRSLRISLSAAMPFWIAELVVAEAVPTSLDMTGLLVWKSLFGVCVASAAVCFAVIAVLKDPPA